jgi:hypothetical protein
VLLWLGLHPIRLSRAAPVVGLGLVGVEPVWKRRLSIACARNASSRPSCASVPSCSMPPRLGRSKAEQAWWSERRPTLTGSPCNGVARPQSGLKFAGGTIATGGNLTINTYGNSNNRRHRCAGSQEI